MHPRKWCTGNNLPTKYTPGSWNRAYQSVKKLRRICREGGKPIPIVFDRGVYVGENTSQAASVEFVRKRRTNYARSRLQKTVEKPQRGFLTDCTPGFWNRACSVFLKGIMPIGTAACFRPPLHAGACRRCRCRRGRKPEPHRHSPQEPGRSKSYGRRCCPRWSRIRHFRRW